MRIENYITVSGKFGIEVFDRGTHFEVQITNRKTGNLCGQTFGETRKEAKSRISEFYV
jgi:hypothetical protein